jgi:signal recognition particle subunit SEC65
MGDYVPIIPVEDQDIARILASEDPTFNEIRTLMRGCRYAHGRDEKFEYADSLLPEASDYLRPYTLRALVRADITEDEAASHLEQSKMFYRRLASLLPAIMKFFSKDAKLRNPRGLVMAIDDCHNEFQATSNAARRDRQIRETKEKLTRAAGLARDSASALNDAADHFQYEYSRYRDIYYPPAPGPARFLSDLIGELQMCAGVLDIMHEIADIKPKDLFVYGNDQRTDLVESVYHMCTMWDGPKLVTTPGSDFAGLCSLIFEAASGNSDEGLAGAINRFARSAERKQWDLEGENEDDAENFQTEKNQMTYSAKTIELCKNVLQKPNLSDMAHLLLNLRIKYEEGQYEDARIRYGPRQVYISQMNQEQWESALMDAVSRFKPEQIAALDDMIMNGRSWATRDIEHGQKIRAARLTDLNAKAENPGN